MDDLISRQAVIKINQSYHGQMPNEVNHRIWKEINELPSAQPERLTDDDFETIRIHLNAYKEKLCNQQRWEEANEYQRILDRFMAFASAQPEPPEWAQKVDEYRKSAPSFVRNQLVWALYQTWKEYDGRLVHQRGKENR